MALANHETQFHVGVDAAFSETSLHKVPIVVSKLRKDSCYFLSEREAMKSSA